MPNALEKNLKQKRSKTIGIITEDLTVFNTPDIVDGIDAYCESHGFDIIIGNMRLFKKYNNDFTETEKHKKLLDEVVCSMAAKQVEGIIYIGYHCREIVYLPNIKSIPFVYAYCFPSDHSIPSVIYDDEQAAYDMTCLMIRSGHNKIGVLCGPFNSFHTQEHLRGFQKSLFENGILYDNRLTVFCSGGIRAVPIHYFYADSGWSHHSWGRHDPAGLSASFKDPAERYAVFL
jgi:LacI family transcriptional regulator